MNTETETAFKELGLSGPLLTILNEIGYETPTPIQAQTIPLILKGNDVLGQAQTGTGKTAAFALPLLCNLKINRNEPQILVLTPTRELAIQVAEAFQKYAKHINGFHVIPIYGGQDLRAQTRSLKRGMHVIVGTPGRIMDHMRRGTLKLGGLSTLVLDEADEMLRMGFIDDVEWILEKTPEHRQTTLFSATMPKEIKRIASRYLKEPVEITVKVKTATADTINQRYWPVRGMHKLDALTRILEAEPFEAMLIFVRTRSATVELAERLEARGYASVPLNGDIPQNQRERTITQLKNGKLDILVATDVAARGLDVDRISHVINYDIPYDTEAYVHRIGRTGRAGRTGEAILFVAPRERRMLAAIERATRQKIDIMELPSPEVINNRRIEKFKQNISDTLSKENLKFYSQIIEQYQLEQNVPAHEIAAALAHLLQGNKPFLLSAKDAEKTDRKERKKSNEGRSREQASHRKSQREPRERSPRKSTNDELFDNLPKREYLKKDTPQRFDSERSDSRKSDWARSDSEKPDSARPDPGMERFRIEVGKSHDVKPANIVGAIANEAGIDSQYIGRITLHDDFSLVDLPEGMPKDIFKSLKNTWIMGTQMKISRQEGNRSSTAKRGNQQPSRKRNSTAKPKRRPRKPPNR